ncbi:NAD-dependent glycerol-3-phosphate dehydrogenase [Streptomyces laurentii]|uniref:NAD-dependent glycerol-3-phosphate dehydrogenase n=1 Tax=Streptomyces laurentii TaxID=39478 RepID=A0A161JH05_STRLU|nr:NAD-dependent glycerol-3-phosphate dehydrogenase [Streptomyces laurentii]
MPQHDTTPVPVTVLGLGLMGRALAAALLAAGHPVTVWNRTPAKAAELAGRGAVAAASVTEAVAASGLVIVCVSDYAAVRTLLGPAAPALAGRTLVNLTSGTSEEARETAAWAAERGAAAYLDGAILTVPQGIGTADAALLFSGPRASFDTYGPALRALGGGAEHLGADHGLAALYDVAMLGLMWSVLNGFLQGAALLGAAGVDAAAFEKVAGPGVGTVAGWLAGYARQIDEGAFPGDDAGLDTHVAAMDHLVHESEALGVSTELPRLVRETAARAMADGRGGEGYATLIRYFRRP